MTNSGYSHRTEAHKNSLSSQLLLNWVDTVTRHAWLITACLVLTTIVASWISIEQFKMNSDTGDLIKQTGTWREDFETYKEEFPLLVDTAVIVVSGTSFDTVEQTARDLTLRIEAQPENFQDIYAVAADDFFRDHALMYMDIADLVATVMNGFEDSVEIYQRFKRFLLPMAQQKLLGLLVIRIVHDR